MKCVRAVLSSLAILAIAGLAVVAGEGAAKEREQGGKSSLAVKTVVPVDSPILFVKADEGKKDTCKPPQQRSCANKCNGEWGMLCPFSTVCDPIKHRCEKAKP